MKTLRTLALSALVCLCGTAFAQNPPITPAWAFGHIVWEDSINTRAAAERLVSGYIEHGIPVDGIIIDSPWTTSYNDYTWDVARYPGHQEMIDNFTKQGVRTILWMTGFVDDKDKEGDTPIGHDAQIDYVRKKGYAVNDGKIMRWWKGEGVHIDFTNPKATKWWYKQMDKAFTKGVCGWKVDQGEYYTGDQVKTSIGTMPQAEFRPYYYNAIFDYTTARKKDGLIIGRPYSHQGGFAASVGKLNMGWCGDFNGNWDGIRLQLDNIYQSAEKGYGAVAMEIGGFFEGRSTREEFIRYFQAGCMMAMMINGGSNGAFTNHLPWWHDAKVAEIYRSCTKLHNSLRPYMFSSVVDCHFNGGSIYRNTSRTQYSHCLGNDIFTKAIVSADKVVSFTLPEGEWIDYWTKQAYKGGTLVERSYTEEQFPLFIRKGAIIPMNTDECLKFLVAPDGKSSRTLHLPKGDGIEYFDCTVTYDAAANKLSAESKVPVSTEVILLQ